ncbi:hypothetical protein MRX96_053623 [Rhipicephalus microplus]
MPEPIDYSLQDLPEMEIHVEEEPKTTPRPSAFLWPNRPWPQPWPLPQPRPWPQPWPLPKPMDYTLKGMPKPESSAEEQPKQRQRPPNPWPDYYPRY